MSVPTLQQRQRFHKNTVLMVDGALVLTCGHAIAGQSQELPELH